ncbi:heterokaryon incompatibility protein-domain-containing protein [Hypoxylon rubiginosum]|uniref:Heterokaryon incompatibility protein-domain-containing protein n=1 Tax=Hypoxylon rubiginosum TaxID=110542 RepID=A0ACB9ZF45_9PEZI|nr:heterokaryon incompatibility protein-domain-containing protein [Hypoxylon rubiginosum]
MTSNYTYKPLNEAAKEIRVLCFEPQESEGEILKGRIEHISLLEEPATKYLAVSYTWGDALIRRTISIDGVEISVPVNSEIALRNLHNPTAIQYRLEGSEHAALASDAVMEDGVCRIWLDAVCINQDDLRERAQQVGLMHDVYSKAVAVLVWLGEDPAGIAQPAFESVYELARTGISSLFAAMSNDGNGRGEFVVRREDLPETVDRGHIQALFSLPWFERVWTIQEAVLNEQTVVILGRRSIDYSTVQLACMSLAQRHYNNDAAGGPISGVDLAVYRTKFNRNRAEDPNRLVDLLERMPFFSATEPRDRVYGALGLISDDTTHSIIDPSYTRTLPEVYARATVAGIVCSGLLRALMKAGNVHRPDPEDEMDKEMPSWAIKCHWKWSEELPVRVYSYRDVQECSTDFSQLPDSVEKSGWRVLPLHGVFLGGIISVSRVITMEDFSNHRQMVEMIQSLYLQTSAALPESESEGLGIIIRILWVLCEARYFKLFLGMSDEEEFIEMFMNQLGSFAGLLKIIWDTDYAGFDTEDLHDMLELLDRMLNMGAKGRRFFITHNGILGRGMPTTEPGDLVCELKGGEVPFMLRKEGEFFKLIGDCFADRLDDIFIMGASITDDISSLMTFNLI